MPLSKLMLTKKGAAFLGFAAVAAAIIVSRGVFADGGPIVRNANPQGTVTTNYVKLTLDTEDLAKCKYSTSDTGYNDMGESFDSTDGLYHTASLGSLSKGSYTYYVRCKDFEGNANSSSTTITFKVGTISCIGDNCPAEPAASSNGPALSGLLPVGVTYDSYVILSVTTNTVADCRYSWYDKPYDSMTLLFSSTDRLYHTATAVLSSAGYYTYYVRCRDDNSGINAVAGRISFRRGSLYVAPVVPADSTPPSISSLAPSGDVNTATTTISCTTDEAATCKYGTTDEAYDSLTGTLAADSGKTSHSAEVTLDAAGAYTYYVRCKDKVGNKNTDSSTISFNYVIPVKDGPAISDLQPSGAIYQQNVALIAQTDKEADCRYSTTDTDFDSMQDSFSTNDGLLQQATVTLGDYAPYAYYVRCRDKAGNKDDKSEIINFEYKNPNPEVVETATTTEAVATTTAVCADAIKAEAKDGACDKTSNCICDPDCPVSGDDADPDCANVVVGGGGGMVVLLLIGLLFIIIVVIIIIIIKRRNTEEDVELP